MSGVDHLVLVGGTCMMPAVRDFVSGLVGREPAAGVDPLSAVAQGAAVAAAIVPLLGDSVSFLERLGPGLDLADLHARVAAALATG